MRTRDLKVIPVQVLGSFRQGAIHGLTAQDISQRLGFKPNIEDDPDKVRFSWGGVIVDLKGKKHKFAIWDYRGSHEWYEFSVWTNTKAGKKLLDTVLGTTSW